MLRAIVFTIVFMFSMGQALSQNTEIPSDMVASVRTTTAQIKKTPSNKSKLKLLKSLESDLTEIYEAQKGMGKKAYGIRYFYFVLQPVLFLNSLEDCVNAQHQLLLIDNGPYNREKGKQEVLPETQVALDLLNAVCGQTLNPPRSRKSDPSEN